MSRCYEMVVTLDQLPDTSPERLAAFQQAIEDEWPIDDWREEGSTGRLQGYGESALAGGESEEGFFRRLTRAVQAVGPCRIELQATCIEAIPFETYVRDLNPLQTGKE